MSIDYKVGLEIAASGNVEEFLGKLASRLLGVHGQVKEIEKGIGNWAKLIGGAALVGAGLETLKFVDHIAKAGGDLQRQANIFRSAGNSIGDTAKAIRGAFEAIQKVPGVDAVDAMKRYREVAGATQDNAGSIKVLPDFLRAQVIYGATTGADPEEGMKRIAKMIELRQGAINRVTHKIEPERFVKELDVAVKALQVGQGLITANDLQMLIKQAGPMAKGMDPMRFWAIYLASLEDMGGARTGTAMTAVARQVLGATMTPKVADEWERVGMLNAPGQGWNMKKGHVNIWDPHKAIRGYETFRDEGFQKFIDDYVRPALQKAGFKSDNEMNAELYKFGSTETARRLYSMYLTGNEQVELEQKKIRQALGLDSYDSIFKGDDYKLGIESLTDSIKSLEEALGGPAAKAIGNMAMRLAEQINKLALVAQRHPHIVEIGTYATMAASGLAVLAGSILAVTAALRIGGWIVGGKGTSEMPKTPPETPRAPEEGAIKSVVDKIERTAKEAAPAIEAGFGGAVKKAFKSGLKGGIIAAVVEEAGEWLINKAVPLTPQEQKFRDESPMQRIREIWDSLKGPTPADKVNIPASSRDYAMPWPSQVAPLYLQNVDRGPVWPLKLVPHGFEGDKVADAFARARYSPVEAAADSLREKSRGAALSKMSAPSVNATLQATVNTTVPVTVQVDSTAVAHAILPTIVQLIQREMHAVAGQLLGATNEIAAYHPAGIGHN